MRADLQCLSTRNVRDFSQDNGYSSTSCPSITVLTVPTFSNLSLAYNPKLTSDALRNTKPISLSDALFNECDCGSSSLEIWVCAEVREQARWPTLHEFLPCFYTRNCIRPRHVLLATIQPVTRFAARSPRPTLPSASLSHFLSKTSQMQNAMIGGSCSGVPSPSNDWSPFLRCTSEIWRKGSLRHFTSNH
jgi:hypothetical protein